MNRAERIRTARRAKRLSQTALAHQVGVSLRTVQEWEAGRTAPRNHNLLRLARVLGLDPEDLA